MTDKSIQYFQMLVDNDFKPTNVNVYNRFAKYDEVNKTSIIIHLQNDGSWRCYNETGAEFANGSSAWELEAQL